MGNAALSSPGQLAAKIPPLVSVIIPTYNREPQLRRTLEALAAQSLPAWQFEVWVVDDGSTEASPAAAGNKLPLQLHYLRQNRKGPTAARNLGAEESCGDLLVFLDDDIRLAPGSLAALVEACQTEGRAIILGSLIAPPQTAATVYARLLAASPPQAETQDDDLPYTRCLTGLLAIRREAFFELGKFQDPTGGWPNWDDLDFGYRATQAGYRLRRCAQAVAEHWDYAAASLAAASARWQRASHSGARLLSKYPQMQSGLPMFSDKRPIVWGHDSPGLAGRKLARQLMSWPPVVGLLEGLVKVIERYWPNEALLRSLYRWIIGAYIFRGFRRGLKEL
jgi:glycosyltransferase involved in cell wall biosynthesis